MLGKVFGFIGKWLGYLILILIGIAFLKNCVFAPENPDSLQYKWAFKAKNEWLRLGGQEFSEAPPFFSPQESIKCLSAFRKEYDSQSKEQMIIRVYNEYLLTQSLKGRALVLGGRGEESRVNSVNSMICADKHSLYYEGFDESTLIRAKVLMRQSETD